MKSSTEIMNKHRLALYSCEIDEDTAKAKGAEVYADDLLAGYFVSGGFNVYTAYTGVSRGNFHRAFKIAGVVAHLNPNVDRLVVYNYMDRLCFEKFDIGSFEISRDSIFRIINNVYDGKYEVVPEERKFFWIGDYTKIGKHDKEINGVVYKGKQSVMMSHMGQMKMKKSLGAIETALHHLLEFGNPTASFLILRDLATHSGISKHTVDNYDYIYKQELDKYNLANFGTCEYPEYRTRTSVGRIVHALSELPPNVRPKSLQRVVSEKSGVSKSRVRIHWESSDVQEAVERYVSWSANPSE